VVAAIYLLTAHWNTGQVNDTQAAIWPAWNFVHHGSFFLDHVRGLPHNIWFSPVNGHLVSNRMMGVVLAGVPISAVLAWTGLTPESLNALNGALIAALAVSFLCLVFREIVTPRLALGASVAVAFGTSLWTVAGAETWPQSVDALCAAMALLAVARSRFWLAGLALAPALLTRPHMAIVALILGLGLSLTKRSFRPLLRIGIPTGAGVAALVLWNHWMFGRWNLGGAYVSSLATATKAPRGAEAAVGFLANAAGAGFTPAKGLFIFTPVALLAVFWIVATGRRTVTWSQIAFIAGLGYEFIQLRLNSYTGGAEFYGNRLVIELVVLSSPLAVVSYQQWAAGHPWRRFSASVFSALGIATYSVGGLLGHSLAGTGTQSDWLVYYPEFVVRAAALSGLMVTLLIGATLLVFVLTQYQSARRPQDRLVTLNNRPNPVGSRVSHPMPTAST
jgi:hypothetical protein